MAQIRVERTHQLTLPQARQAVQQVADSLAGELKANYRWQGDRLAFECPGAEGMIQLDDAQVIVVLKLSWLLSPARGTIERSINGYLDRYLNAES